MQRTYYSLQKDFALCVERRKKNQSIQESNNEMGTAHWRKAAQIK